VAITSAQRSTALGQILLAALQASGAGSPIIPLSQMLPGVTPAQVLATFITAIGTNMDTSLTTALSNMVTFATAASVSTISAEAVAVATDQSNITAWTVQ
jgi:hypothetical protein